MGKNRARGLKNLKQLIRILFFGVVPKIERRKISQNSKSHFKDSYSLFLLIKRKINSDSTVFFQGHYIMWPIYIFGIRLFLGDFWCLVAEVFMFVAKCDRSQRTSLSPRKISRFEVMPVGTTGITSITKTSFLSQKSGFRSWILRARWKRIFDTQEKLDASAVINSFTA